MEYEGDSLANLVFGIFVILFSLVGLVGNGLSAFILSRPEMRSSINCALQGLAFYDSIVLLTTPFTQGVELLSPSVMFHAYYMKWVYPISLMGSVGSSWTTVVLSLERYVAICHPFKAKYLCSYKRARICNIVLFVFAVCFNIPRFWDLKVGEETDSANQTRVFVAASSLLYNEIYFNVYAKWLSLLVWYIIPFLLLAVLNGFICKGIHAANRSRQSLGQKTQSEIKLASMLVSVVAVFFMCHTICFSYLIMGYMNDAYPKFLVGFASAAVTFNSSVNFIIYYLWVQKFREIFAKVFCTRCARLKRPASGKNTVCAISPDSADMRSPSSSAETVITTDLHEAL